MIHSKAIDVLKTFTKEELKQFSDFVRSPFFNKNKNLIKLYDALVKYHPEYEVENEKVYSKVYPFKVYSHDIMKKLMSEVFRVAEIFLSEIHFRKEKFYENKYLLDEYDSRNLDNLFLLKIKSLEDSIANNEIYPVSFFEKHRLERSKIYFNYNRESYKDSIESIIEANDMVLCHALDYIFYDYCQLEGAMLNYNIKTEFFSTKEFLINCNFENFLLRLSNSKNKNHFLYFQTNLILMYLYQENEKYFKDAKQVLIENSDELLKTLSEERIFFCFGTLEDYCLTKLRTSEKFIFQYFELCDFKIQQMINFYSGKYYMSFLEFGNIVKIALHLDKVDWTENFIRNFINFVGTEEKENIQNHSKALIEFQKKNYEISLEYTSKVKFSDISYKTESKILTLYNLFELSLYEETISGIDTIKHYIANTNELTKYRRDKLNITIKICLELIKLKLNPLKVNYSLIAQMKNDNSKLNLLQRKWNSEKIEELENLYFKKNKIKERKIIKSA